MSDEIVKGITLGEFNESLSLLPGGKDNVAHHGESLERWFRTLAEKHSRKVLEDFIADHFPEDSKVSTTYAGKYTYSDPDWCNDKEYGRVYSDLEGDKEVKVAGEPYMLDSPYYGRIRVKEWHSVDKGSSAKTCEPKKGWVKYDYEDKAGTVEFHSSSKESITANDVKTVLSSAISEIDGTIPEGYMRSGSSGVWYKRDLPKVTELKENAVKEKRYETAAQLRSIEDKLQGTTPEHTLFTKSNIDKPDPRPTDLDEHGCNAEGCYAWGEFLKGVEYHDGGYRWKKAKIEVPCETKYKVGDFIFTLGNNISKYRVTKVNLYDDNRWNYVAMNLYDSIAFYDTTPNIFPSIEELVDYVRKSAENL